MPDPTKEQVIAARNKVLQSAPPGLSQEQLMSLVNDELNPTVPPASLASGFTRIQPESSAVQHEPDTFGGGFMKSLKDQVLESTVGNPMLQHAANPESTGDFLSLAIPSMIPNLHIADTAARYGNALVEGFKGGEGGILSRVLGYPGRVMNKATQSFSQVTPVGDQIERAAAGRSTPPTTRAGFQNQPLYKQMEQLPETGVTPTGRIQDPVHQVQPKKPPAGVKLNKNAPKTVEEALTGVMQEGMPAEREAVSTMGPEATTVGEGATKQSGKFGRSQSLGQAQGYSSGRPSVASEFYAPESQFMNQDMVLPDDPLTTQFVDMPSASQAGIGDTVKDTGGSLSPSSPPAPDAIYSSGPVDTTGWTQTEWAELRRLKGARDAGKMTGKTAEEVRKLSGGGPSQTPLEAEERIRAAEAAQRGR